MEGKAGFVTDTGSGIGKGRVLLSQVKVPK